MLGCGDGPLRIRRHNALCELVFEALRIDNPGTKRESRCSSDDNSRPGDIFHPDFAQGKAAYFDLTVRNSFQHSYLLSSASTAGTAAAAGELEKDIRYLETVEASGCSFYPLAVESFGVWTPSSLELLKSIARKTTLHTGTRFNQAINRLHEQLSTRLWRYNAKLALDRLVVCLADSDIFL